VKKDLFCYKLLKIKKERASNSLAKCDFLHKKTADDLLSRIDILYLKNKKILLLGDFPNDSNIFHSKEINTEQISRIDDGYVGLSGLQEKFDLIISNLELHFINDIKGYLVEIKSKLNNDGVFLASFFGGESLYELKRVFMHAAEQTGSIYSTRSIPFCDIKSVGMLVKNTGFEMPVIDSSDITIKYNNLFEIIRDLRGMAQTNILFERSKEYVGKDFFNIANKIYLEKFSQDKKLLVNIDLISITAINLNDN
jgi:NADH dehydrogenase [ubiquinone] 1 alpha subcomplex assembly factor 5